MNAPSPAPTPAARPRRILIAEDESLIAEELRTRLQRMGLVVTAAVASAEEALEAVARTAPDLVLMDIQLKGRMDGIEAADSIRQRYHVPVIYLTAHSDFATIARAKVTEPFGYLLKPFDERDLRIAIELALHKHEMEWRLRESEQRLATTLTSIADGVIATDGEGRITFLNPVAGALTGWSLDAAKGQPVERVFRLVHAVSGQVPENPIRRAIQDNRVVTLGEQMLLKTKEGVDLPVEDTAAPIVNNGRVVGAVLVFRDVSERQKAEAALRKSEDQLHKAQKLEAIGRLAGGVAHDVNNMMTVVVGYAELLLREVDARDPKHRVLLEMRRAANRSADIARQLLAVGRRQLLQPAVAEIGKLVDDICPLVRQLLGTGIELRCEVESGNATVLVDSSQFDRVMVNLSLNAREAMPDGGVLTIASREVTVGQDALPDAPEVPPGDYVWLSVSDTGRGMDADTTSRLFEPFFTTKSFGEGVGLGLATVYGIVRQSGGHLSAASELGQGTTFNIYLPRLGRPGSSRVALRADAVERGCETILLVEDDHSVRTMIQQVLRSHGYTVVEAIDGPQAMLLCEDASQRIDLLLTDAVMPGMNGRELAERLVAVRPGVAVLMMSGYGEDRVIAQGLPINAAFIQKPFAGSQLAARVRTLLDADGEEPHR
jgi:two-component system cell cycle sensor histidine kinase/response regulator CckA